jgi:hypothetical protein
MMLAEGPQGLDGIELEPTLEELDVPVGPVSKGRSRAVPLLIGVVGAVAGWGFIGASSDQVGQPAGGSAVATASAPTPLVRITSPGAGAHTGTPVRVTGVATVPMERLVVTVVLGELVLGQETVPVRDGGFEVGVPILAPPRVGEVAAVIRVTRPSATGVLAERTVRLNVAPAVTVDAIARVAADVPVIEVSGSATLETRTVSVTIAHRYGTATTEAIVGPYRDPTRADAAGALGIGRWIATFSVAHAPWPVRAVVRWADGTPAGGALTIVDAEG